jgi:hypothetical protein
MIQLYWKRIFIRPNYQLEPPNSMLKSAALSKVFKAINYLSYFKNFTKLAAATTNKIKNLRKRKKAKISRLAVKATLTSRATNSNPTRKMLKMICTMPKRIRIFLL